MKPSTGASAALSLRCSHRSSTGRQCRLLVADLRSTLCPQHRAAQMQRQSSDISFALAGQAQAFQTAQGINHSLGALYRLLAENRISARRAAVLAYINSLLLRTLPAIDADNDAGIELTASPNLSEAATEGTTQDTDDDTAEDAIEITAKTATHRAVETVVEKTASWGPSIPDPDPTKKPS